MKRRTNGFTLIELMIVMGILGILAGVAVQNGTSATEESRATVCEKNRSVIEEQEGLFVLREGRHTEDLQELVDHEYLTRITCPKGGIFAWEQTDPDAADYHTSLLCSVHGKKRRIQPWEHGDEGGGEEPEAPSGPPPLGAGFESGELGDWAALGAVSVVGAAFGSLFAGDAAAYVDTNKDWTKVEPLGKVASFLGLKKKELEALSDRTLTGGSAMRLEVEEGSLEGLRLNFLTQEAPGSWWFNDTAFLSVTNKETGRRDVYKIADTFSDLQKSGTQFAYETGWLSLADLGHEIEIGKGDVVGVGVLNATDKVVSSAVLVDE